MSSDGMDSGATWRTPRSSGQDDPQSDSSHQQAYYYDPEHDEYVGIEQEPPFVDADAYAPTSQEARSYRGRPTDSPGIEEEAQISPADRREALLRTLGNYILYIGAPLIFGGLTALFVLPSVLNGHAAASQVMFWPLVVLLILIAIAQGTVVYYFGTINDLWYPFTLLGFFLFLLLGAFASFGAISGILMLILIVALCVFLVRRYLQSVPEGSVVIVSSFGKYRRTLFPGPHLLLPWDRVLQEYNVGEVQWICPTQRVQLSRDEDVILRAAISYQLLPEDAYLATIQATSWETSLRELFLGAIQTIATTFTPDDFIAWPNGLHSRPALNPSLEAAPSGARWEQVNGYLYQFMSEQASTWGIQINWIRIRDVALTPHGAHLVNTAPSERDYQFEEAQAHNTRQAPPPTPKSEVEPTPAGPPPVFKEEVLIKAYRQVQEGKISDPQTIRNLAQRFEAIARNPEASQSVSFDPQRAAENLYTEALRNEQNLGSRGPAPDTFDENTNPNWHAARRHSTDENMLAGG
ncbi:SPFH domain-containing protein [Ktedonospora formicarum]|uniref:Band 7 domain-containing protein n=1 Tax=Ktedonospora formicarum TaxID=2778364 RepID=A0A8J3HWR6_9CHLR|nr:SPFH domain-containing protein [Ktedonospora formicarum]GHO44661.1 hypothetical protein KSX_28240 [Ktedonospora formicarum]